MRKVIAIAAVIAYVTPGYGGCDDVYVNNVRNRTFTENDAASLNTLYDHLCSSSGSKKA